MKATFISTVLGQDSSGIISRIAEITRKYNGEWKTSKAIKLGGQFIAMMEVTIDADRKDALKAELGTTFPELTFFAAPKVERKSGPVVMLEIDCPDRPGLTREITQAIENLSVVIEHFECNRYPVTAINENVFSAKISMEIPEGRKAEDIAGELRALDNRLKVIVL